MQLFQIFQKLCSNQFPRYLTSLKLLFRSEWLELKQQYKNLQRHEYEKLKKTTKILKSEIVRRKELKEKLLATTSSKDRSLNFEQKGHIDSSNEIKSENRKRKLEVPVDAEMQPLEKKASLSNYEMETGSVARLSTTGENLTKDIIKVTTIII